MAAQDMFSSMRRVILAGATAMLSTCCAWSEERNTPAASQSASADRRVEAALRSELAGDNEQRRILLHEALVEAPDHAPAHWQSGQVRRKNTWMALADVERQAQEDRSLSEYRRLRALAALTVDGQSTLARWCRKSRLEDQQRVHWLIVLQLHPDNAEAIASLKLKPYLGTLMTPSQIQQAKRQVHDVSEAEKRWRPLVARWRSAAEPDQESASAEIREKIRAISRPTEMLALERTLWQQADGQHRKATYRATALDMIKILADNPHPAASESLARHAAFSNFEDVRDSAVGVLARRPLDHFVPQLLSALQSPVEEEVRYRISASGHLASHYSLLQEGPLGNLRTSLLLSPVVQNEVLLVSSAPSGKPLSAATAAAWQNNAANSAVQADRDAEAFHAAVDRANREIGSRNARITMVLHKATGQQLGEEPMKWWKWWWQDYNEQYSVDGRNGPSAEGRPSRPEYRNDAAYDYPVYATPVVAAPQDAPSGPSPSGSAGQTIPTSSGAPGSVQAIACSCFARGTKVWTLTGRTPIEQICIGDQVLAQDPESGELAYKPVLGVTLRPPGPRLKIVLHNEAITATPSHPFWVSGQGWRMTKQLSAANSLHTLSGSMRIETIEAVETPLAHYEFAYNLIIADFNTYFVGEEGVLVHDNTPRQPTAALLPGLTIQEIHR